MASGHVNRTQRPNDDVGEQEGAPLILGNATKKLAAHDRMKLGIFVDGLVDMKIKPATSSSARCV